MTVTLELPEELEREIEKAGLLAPDTVEAIFREQLRRFHLGELLKDARKMAADNIPPMTMEEIQAEVDATRSMKRRNGLLVCSGKGPVAAETVRKIEAEDDAA